MNRIEKVFYIITLILIFQITRNISTFVYISALFITYGALYIFFIFGNRKTSISLEFNILNLIFVLTLIWIPIISLANVGINDYLKSLPRYLVTFPYILFCMINDKYSIKLVKKVLRLLCIFMGIASLTIPYQIIFGPIGFFADYSYREGVVRYASLAGSLTALGTLGGYALAILLFTDDYLFTKKIKAFNIIIIIFGMLMSLQKAAIANIIICFGLYIFLNNEVRILKKISIVIGLMGSLYLSYLIAIETDFAMYIQRLIQYSFAGSALGLQQDLISRILELPKIVMSYNNIDVFDIFFGIGFPALGGIIGLPHYPMAHNNYFDLVFSGGILFLISFLFLMLRIPIKVCLRRLNGLKVNIIDRSYAVVIVLILVNMVIGAGSFFQPISMVFTFFLLSSYRISSLQFMRNTS